MNIKRQYKKFALIGTSCVGKTTLVLELEKILQKKYSNKIIATVPEAARHYFEKRKVRNPFSYINQYNIQTLAKEFEKQAELQKPDIIICDRSVLDAVVYIKTMGTQKETEKLLKRVRNWLATYSHFFLLDPAEVNYQTDVIRKEDMHVREAFHNSFLDLLQDLMLPYTLISGNEKQRVNKMTDIISSFII